MRQYRIAHRAGTGKTTLTVLRKTHRRPLRIPVTAGLGDDNQPEPLARALAVTILTDYLDRAEGRPPSRSPRTLDLDIRVAFTRLVAAHLSRSREFTITGNELATFLLAHLLSG